MGYEEIEHYHQKIKELELQYWLENSFVTPAWWVLAAAAVIPWLVWYRYVDRSRFLEIISFGFLWIIFAMALDEISSTWLLWSYPRKLFPIIPPLLPADLTIVPIVFMFIYQKTTTFKWYMIWTIVISAVFSFVIEVIFVRFNLFKIYEWNHWCSFISFIIVSAIIKVIQQRLLKITKIGSSVT